MTPLRQHRATEPPPRHGWPGAHAFGLAALALGVAAFLTVSLTAKEMFGTPDWRISVPFFVATAGAAACSILRRERAIALPLLGVALAAAAVVLG
jgi:protein-S-isoprenylcysteine O-methyltransferase Ste14